MNEALRLLARLCPLCDKQMDAELCAECNVPTIESSVFEAPEEAIHSGMVIAGRYKVIRLAGRGAMGSVFEATQLSMDRRVALKTLQKNLISDQKLVKRFYLEARAASQLDHPNIVRIFDFGIDDGTKVPYIAMEYLEGGDLSDSIESIGAMTERESCRLLAQVAKALVAAHEKQIVHRDLKPDNINLRTLADGDQHAKVLDFGIAKVLHGGSDSLKSLTGTGMTMGTPLYMSPEQIRGEKVDFRTDLYALGCILHELLTGQRPYSSDERMGIFMQHISADVPVLPEVLVNQKPPSQALLVLHRTLLSKKRADRPESTSAVAKILTACSRGDEIDAISVLGVEPTILEGLGTSDQQQVSTEPVSNIGTENTMAAPALGTTPSSAVETAEADADLDELPGSSGSGKKALGLAVIGVAAAAAAAMFLMPSEEPKPTEAPSTKVAAAAPESPEAPAAKKVAKAEPVEAIEKPKPAEPAVAPKPELPAVVFRIETTPPGATVREGATSLGNSPVELMIAEGVPSRTLDIEMRGHKMKTVKVDRAQKNPLKVVLEANPEPPPTTSKRPKRPVRTQKRKASKAPKAKKPAPAKPKKSAVPVW